MKSIKELYMGKPLREVYPHATLWKVIKWKTCNFMRKLLLSLTGLNLVMWLFVGIFYAGSYYMPKYVYAEKKIEVVIEKDSPVLQRIAKCESGDAHYKNGQVIIRANSNGTTDIGRYQINSVWNKKATELGLDLTKEKDNETMARWIYANRGTEDWYPSKGCWNK